MKKSNGDSELGLLDIYCFNITQNKTIVYYIEKLWKDTQLLYKPYLHILTLAFSLVTGTLALLYFFTMLFGDNQK